MLFQTAQRKSVPANNDWNAVPDSHLVGLRIHDEHRSEFAKDLAVGHIAQKLVGLVVDVL